MTMRRVVLVGAAILAPAAAHAGDTPRYAPAPAWVKPATLPPITPDTPLLMVLDLQQRIADGEVWSYQETAARMISADVLSQAGTIKLAWQPDDGDIIIHRAVIVRGGQEIDLLKGGSRFTVLRREGELEALQISGILTATMPAEGLRVDDVLRVAYSVTRRDAVLAGAAQTVMPLVAEPLRIGFARARLLWAPGVELKFKSLAPGAAPTPRTLPGGDREIELALPLGKPAEVPGDAPARYKPLPLLEASTFADWAAVSKAMAPLYRTQGLITAGSPLAGEVDKIAKAESDPRRRAAAVLRVVQDGVRYLAVNLNGGNYRPQPPERTWALRYGDCKAKTLLLLAMLHALGVEAEPVMANSALGDVVPKRLPAPAAFDHILVRVAIGGDSLWLDGTGLGTRLADLGDTPPFGWVLPAREAGAALIEVPRRPAARASADVDLDLDLSAGIGLPGLYRTKITIRGRDAGMISAGLNQLGGDQRREALQGIVQRAVDGQAIDQSFAEDRDAGTIVITGSGIVQGGWTRDDKRWVRPIDRVVSEISFEPDRARPAWRDIPVATPPAGSVAYHMRVTLPAGSFALDGDQTLPATLAGVPVSRKASLANGVVVVDERADPIGAEIAPAAVAAERARVALARARLLRVMGPEEMLPWRTVEAARKGGKIAALEAAYARAIAADAKAEEPYENRANFRAGVFDWRGAIADLDKVVEIQPSVAAYLRRGSLLAGLGEHARAGRDAAAALELDPTSNGAVELKARMDAEQGKGDAALAELEERIGAGGQERTAWLTIKSSVLSRLGRGADAVAAADAALAIKPGDPGLYNQRCWTKAINKLALDTALKDCTRAIELGEQPSAAFDSRALVYLQMGRLDEALADAEAALDIAPGQTASLYLRGVIRKRKGDPRAADDLTAARLMQPRIDIEYARYGVTA